MKYEDKTKIEELDLTALYPRIIEKHENYEIWQHPYVREDVLENDPDFQLVYFNKDGSVDSYHVSSKEYRFKDLTHLGKLQLVYHDITLNFNEYTHLIKDAYSREAGEYFLEILKSKGITVSIEKYFDYEYASKLKGDEIYSILTSESILEYSNFLSKNDLDESNIYFKLLATVLYLEEDFESNVNEIAYLYFLIGEYVGLWLHPNNGDEIAIHYLNKAIDLERNEQNIQKCINTIKMINREDI